MTSLQPTDRNINKPDLKNVVADRHTHFRSDLERIAQVMYTQNLTLVQVNRTLSILRAIDLIILESNRDLKQLSHDISQSIIDSSPYIVAAVLSLNFQYDQYLNFRFFSKLLMQ